MTPRRRLFYKYVVPIIAIVVVALAASGGIGIYFSYKETRSALLALQREKAAGAAARMEQFVREIERQIGWTALPQVLEGGDPLQLRRLEYVKLAKQVQAITEACFVDHNGREQVCYSRLKMDVLGSGADLSQDPRVLGASEGKTYFGPVYFRKETEPYMALAMRAGREGAGVTTIEVNLKFVWEVIQQIKIGKTGFAYVVNRDGHLVAHPDISLVLQKTDFSMLPQVKAALANPEATAEEQQAIEARDRAGRRVLTAYARIEPLEWLVFVQQPAAEAYAPLYAPLLQIGLLLLLGLAMAVIASLALARYMVKPINALREGAAAIGAGNLDQQIDVRTGDELQDLADQFNTMTGKLRESYAGLERKVEARTAELQETLEQQTATGEILKVISSSPTDMQPVFDAIVNSGVRLFEGAAVGVALPDGDQVRAAAIGEGDPERAAMGKKRFPFPLTREYMHGVAILDCRVIDVPDAQHHAGEWEAGVKNFLASGYRAITIMPMIRGEAAIGAISVMRLNPGPLSDKQFALLRTFADQAVIAIENVRLFNETKEALEHQKASAEILRAISGSMTEAQPVFDAIVKNCHALFGGSRVALGLVHEDRIEVRASVGGAEAPDTYAMAIDRASGLATCILEARTIHLPDLAKAADEFPRLKQMGLQTGYGSGLFTPLLREGRATGAISVLRPAQGAFKEKEIALLRTFADQAVIAIENVRLFNETRESLEQQKASGEVLGVISSSIADTAPVFDKIIESCERLFAGRIVGLNLVGEDGRIRIGAYHGPGREALERIFPLELNPDSGSGLAILERRVVHYPDVEHGEEVPAATRQGCKAIGIRSAIFSPMLWEGRGIGVVFVGRDHLSSFSEKEIALLRTFSDQAAIAIQNARLFRAIQEKSVQLEIANKHKSEFLANMSHELRTPLNAIIGFSEVLLEKMFGEVNEKQLDYLNDIHSSGRHLLSLINDILDLSKIEAGRMDLELSTFDLPAALSNAMTLVRERAQRHGIALALEVDPRLGEVQADERKCKQILLNLLSNAVKFTPDGGRISVRATPDTDKVEIAVADTGIGIAKDDQDAVFEEFKQVGGDYTRKAEGTGLGLALTKRFVELHGGTIRLESEPGKGSTFTFTIPVQP